MVILGTACGDDTTGGGADEASGETSEPSDEPCDCEEDVESWTCECYLYDVTEWRHQGYYCASEATSADLCADWCQYHVPTGLDWDLTGPIGCLVQGSSASCTTWNPASEVSYNTGTGVYTMDYAFVWGLVEDPDPLWGCDNATVLLGENGFEIAGANSGELLYQLGLRNGDIIMSINNLDLHTYADVGYAFSALWSNGVTSYTLEVERNSTPIELDYYVAVTF